MTGISLGMPALPPPVLAPRRRSRQIRVGKVLVGGDAPVSVQSMTTTLTADVNATLQQIAGLSIRIGVNAGSLDPRLLARYGKATPEALVESAVWEASLFEEHDFHDFKISVKHNDPVVMVKAYRLLAERGDWPLHLGVTEAGPAFQGTIKSATAFGILLGEGIGDTIRVSLSAPPVEEVKVGLQILQSLNLRERRLEIVSCPSCGRAQVAVYSLANNVTAGLEGME